MSGGSAYPCDGHIPAAKLGAGLMSHLPEHYTKVDLAARLEIVKRLRLGGPLNIWVDVVGDTWLPLLADYIGVKPN